MRGHFTLKGTESNGSFLLHVHLGLALACSQWAKENFQADEEFKKLLSSKHVVPCPRCGAATVKVRMVQCVRLLSCEAAVQQASGPLSSVWSYNCEGEDGSACAC